MTMSPSSRGPAGSVVLVDAEGEHVGRPRPASVARVELGDPVFLDELDGDVTVGHAGRRDGEADEALHLGQWWRAGPGVAEDLDLDEAVAAHDATARRDRRR